MKFLKDKRRLRVVHHDLRAEVNDMLAADLENLISFTHGSTGHVDRSITDPLTFVYDNEGNLQHIKFCKKI